jgi:hypothetical protein
MGSILDSRILKKDKVICKISLTKNELQSLKGHLKKVHIFARNLCTKEECIKTRGNKNTTKYLPIPLTLKPKRKNYKRLTYQKIETPKEIFYIYGLKS